MSARLPAQVALHIHSIVISGQMAPASFLQCRLCLVHRLGRQTAGLNLIHVWLSLSSKVPLLAHGADLTSTKPLKPQ